MKKLFILLVFVFALPKAQAQLNSEPLKDNAKPYYWFGIDYSNVKIIDCISTLITYEDSCLIRDKYFKAWNNLTVSERKKYSVEKMLRMDTVIYDVKYINRLNAEIPITNLYAEDSQTLSDSTIKQALMAYDFEQKSGVGVMLVAEYMNKTRVEASHVLLIFNIENREILTQKRFTTAPAGMGFRNYWAGSFYKIFSQVSAQGY